jgi:hypothetical protein
MIVALALIAGCQKKTSVKTPGPVEQESYTVRFIGYKITAKVNATPAELEKYLLDVKTLERTTKTYKLKMVGPKTTLSKPGDMVEMKMDIAGISIPGKALLVRYNPGSEIWLVLFGKFGGTGIIRFSFKEVKDGTKLSMKFEFGEMENLLQVVNLEDSLKQTVMNLVEASIAKGMANFDKSVTAEQLLEKGIRGETYETFYNGHRASIWVNAYPATVDRAIRDQNLWDELNKTQSLNMGNCVITAKPEPCPIRMKIFGLDYNFNSFMVSSKPGEQIASYWASEQLISHNQLLMKPERGGTRFSFVYVMEVPQAMSTEGTNLIMSMTSLPEYIEKVLIEIKNNVEGIG